MISCRVHRAMVEKGTSRNDKQSQTVVRKQQLRDKLEHTTSRQQSKIPLGCFQAWRRDGRATLRLILKEISALQRKVALGLRTTLSFCSKRWGSKQNKAANWKKSPHKVVVKKREPVSRHFQRNTHHGPRVVLKELTEPSWDHMESRGNAQEEKTWTRTCTNAFI